MNTVTVAAACLSSCALFAHASASVPPANCKAAMDADCNADSGCVDSIKTAGGALPLLALFDTTENHDPPSWRCYSPSSLTANDTKYSKGDLFCSREAELEAVLRNCSQSTVYRSGENNTFCYRIPNVLEVNSTLLVFAEAREKSCSDSGPKYLAVRRSTDSGASWGPIQSVYSDPAGTVDGLNLGTSTLDASTNTIFVHYTVCAHACPVSGLFVVNSTDGGASWGEPVNLTSVAYEAGWSMVNPGPGTGVQLSDGSLVVAFWGARASNPRLVEGGVAALISNDHGHTWEVSAPVESGNGYGFNECQLAVQSNGSLLLNARDALQPHGHYARALVRSDDGGRTWSAPWRSPSLTMTTCQGSMISVPVDSAEQLSADRRLVFSSPVDLYQRTTGFLRTSDDDGASWWIQNPQIDAAAPGFGYSGLVDLGPADGSTVSAPSRNVGIVYETAGEESIVFTTQRVDLSP